MSNDGDLKVNGTHAPAQETLRINGLDAVTGKKEEVSITPEKAGEWLKSRVELLNSTMPDFNFTIIARHKEIPGGVMIFSYDDAQDVMNAIKHAAGQNGIILQ